jgi:hypothetical protein
MTTFEKIKVIIPPILVLIMCFYALRTIGNDPSALQYDKIIDNKLRAKIINLDTGRKTGNINYTYYTINTTKGYIMVNESLFKKIKSFEGKSCIFYFEDLVKDQSVFSNVLFGEKVYQEFLEVSDCKTYK